MYLIQRYAMIKFVSHLLDDFYVYSVILHQKLTSGHNITEN